MDNSVRSQDQVVKALRKQIELLRERRQALITAAVTGELEIPEVAA
jgi:type I restriction enzyme S subunit